MVEKWKRSCNVTRTLALRPGSIGRRFLRPKALDTFPCICIPCGTFFDFVSLSKNVFCHPAIWWQTGGECASGLFGTEACAWLGRAEKKSAITLHSCLYALSSALASLVVQGGLLWSSWIRAKSFSVFRVILSCPLLGMICYYWQGWLGRKQNKKTSYETVHRSLQGFFFHLRTKSRFSSSRGFLVLIFSYWEKQS